MHEAGEQTQHECSDSVHSRPSYTPTSHAAQKRVHAGEVVISEGSQVCNSTTTAFRDQSEPFSQIMPPHPRRAHTSTLRRRASTRRARVRFGGRGCRWLTCCLIRQVAQGWSPRACSAERPMAPAVLHAGRTGGCWGRALTRVGELESHGRQSQARLCALWCPEVSGCLGAATRSVS